MILSVPPKSARAKKKKTDECFAIVVQPLAAAVGAGRVPVAHARAAAGHRPETQGAWHVRRLHVAISVSDGRADPI